LKPVRRRAKAPRPRTDPPAEHVRGRSDCHRGFSHRRVPHTKRVQPAPETVVLLQRQTVPQESHQIRAPAR